MIGREIRFLRLRDFSVFLRSLHSFAAITTFHQLLITSPVDFLLSALRLHPELAIYLTVSLGFLIGRIRIAGFTLGSVTGVLITALVVGQLDIPVSPGLK